MLVLTRRLGEAIRIGSDLRVQIVSVTGSQVRVAIEAPDDVPIHREEIFERVVRANRRVSIESRRLGRIEVVDSDLIRFDGFPGFPNARRFALLKHDRETPFAWLACMDDPDLAFVVTSPWQFVPDYEPELGPSHLRAVAADDPASLDLLVIADVRGGRIHLNLAAPLLIDLAQKRGAQIILESGDHSTRRVVEPAAKSAP